VTTFPKDPLQSAAQWRARGEEVAIATVMETWGSSPRPAGSQLAVNENGDFAGSVSAGCVESTVITCAQRVLAGGPPEILELGIDDGMAWDVGLSCGGQIAILVERLEPDSDWLDALLEARGRSEPIVLATNLRDGEQQLFKGVRTDGDAPARTKLEASARQALAQNRCRRETTDEGAFFLHPFIAAPRLVIVGAVHIAEPLLVLARLCEFECIVVEPRQVFAERASFEHAPLLRRWPDEAFDSIGIDAHTAVVTLSHDPKLDDPALEHAMRAGAFYVGALGSHRSHENRLARLRQRGLPEEDLARLHGPVGLAIGALSPAEIAVSILAEVIAARRGQSGAGFRGRTKVATTPNKATLT